MMPNGHPAHVIDESLSRNGHDLTGFEQPRSPNPGTGINKIVASDSGPEQAKNPAPPAVHSGRSGSTQKSPDDIPESSPNFAGPTLSRAHQGILVVSPMLFEEGHF
jgi:hypothetical protein